MTLNIGFLYIRKFTNWIIFRFFFFFYNTFVNYGSPYDSARIEIEYCFENNPSCKIYLDTNFTLIVLIKYRPWFVCKKSFPETLDAVYEDFTDYGGYVVCTIHKSYKFVWEVINICHRIPSTNLIFVCSCFSLDETLPRRFVGWNVSVSIFVYYFRISFLVG